MRKTLSTLPSHHFIFSEEGEIIPLTHLITLTYPERKYTVKTVIHLMYKDVDVDLDFTELDTPEQIKATIENFLLQEFKPRPKFVKNDAAKKNDVVGKFGEIKFIDEGKTKNDKPCFFLRVLTDDMPEDTVKTSMVEIMSMPITAGRKVKCIWDEGTRVQIIKNDKGYFDVDDASDTTRDMSDDEKKALHNEPPF